MKKSSAKSSVHETYFFYSRFIPILGLIVFVILSYILCSEEIRVKRIKENGKDVRVFITGVSDDCIRKPEFEFLFEGKIHELRLARRYHFKVCQIDIGDEIILKYLKGDGFIVPEQSYSFWLAIPSVLICLYILYALIIGKE